MKRRLLLRTVDQPTPKFGTWRLLQQENGHAAMHLADANNRYVVSSGHRQAPEGVVRGGRGLQKKKEERGTRKMKKSRSRKSGEWNSQEAACRRRNNFLSSSFSVLDADKRRK